VALPGSGLGTAKQESSLNKSSQLRLAMQGDAPVQCVGAHNGLGAKLAEEAGFDAVWASGLEISTAACVPDANILTMTQFLAAAVEMDHATRLPVVSDCDTGFGNSNNVIHMVKCYEAAGIAAVCMEDKLFPKVNSFVPGRQQLAPIAEFVGKIMAAKNAQRTEEFMVVARVEALIAGWGHDEAITRAEAYRRAGADAILIHSKQRTPEEITAFLEEWDHRGPIAVVPTTYPQITASELKAAGASLVIYANHGLRAGIGAVTETFARILKDEGTMNLANELVPMMRVFEIQGMVRMKEQEKEFLRTGAKPVRVVIPAGGDIDLPEDLAALVTANGPRAMLDLYGKPMVERQLDAFALGGVQDVALVGPFERKDIPVENLEVVHCESTSMLDTVHAGLAACPPRSGGATLICYSDILFGKQVVDRIVGCDAEVGILVDQSFREGGRSTTKALDYVFTEPAPAPGRLLDLDRRYIVQEVGKHIDSREANFEFIGLMSLDETGYAMFMKRYDQWKVERAGKPFGHAKTFEQATLTDFLQELADSGQTVTAVVQDRGWLEVHDFDDYRAAIKQLSGAADR
jgi:phosphoenolpyruvate phosphomutase